MRNKKAIALDFDGTLVNTVPAGFEAACRIFDEVGLPKPSFEDYFVHLHPPPTDFYHARGIDLPDDEIWKRFLEHTGAYEKELFPDTVETLAEIAWQSEKLGITHVSIVSTQRNHILTDALAKTKIRKFFHEVIGEVDDKSAVLEGICREQGIGKKDLIFVGDFPSDMRDGSRAGVVTIGVTQCMPDMPHTLGRLLFEAGADHCIANLKELLGVLNGIM